MITQDYTVCPSERVLLFVSSLTIIILTIFSICRSRAEINYSECIFERDNLLSWKIVTELADYRASKNNRILFFFLSNTPFDYSFDLIGDHVPCRKNRIASFSMIRIFECIGLNIPAVVISNSESTKVQRWNNNRSCVSPHTTTTSLKVVSALFSHSTGYHFNAKWKSLEEKCPKW